MTTWATVLVDERVSVDVRGSDHRALVTGSALPGDGA